MADSKHEKWLEKSRAAEGLLWALYDKEIEGDSNLGMRTLHAWKSVHKLSEYIEGEITDE